MEYQSALIFWRLEENKGLKARLEKLDRHLVIAERRTKTLKEKFERRYAKAMETWIR